MAGTDVHTAHTQPPKRLQKQCCGLKNSQGIPQGSLTIPRALKEASESIRTLQKPAHSAMVRTRAHTLSIPPRAHMPVHSAKVAPIRIHASSSRMFNFYFVSPQICVQTAGPIVSRRRLAFPLRLVRHFPWHHGRWVGLVLWLPPQIRSAQEGSTNFSIMCNLVIRLFELYLNLVSCVERATRKHDLLARSIPA